MAPQWESLGSPASSGDYRPGQVWEWLLSGTLLGQDLLLFTLPRFKQRLLPTSSCLDSKRHEVNVSDVTED